MATNTYTATKTINGTEYTCQFNGISAALQAVDNSYIDGSTNTSLEKLSKYLFDYVIVSPRVSIDDFGADKIGETQTKKIGDREYTVKFAGMLSALRAIDNSYIDGSSNTSVEKLSKYLFENIVVTPENLSIDDFDSMDEFNEVVSFAREAMQGWGAMGDFNELVAFAREVMQGNFRNKAVKPKSATKESKE